MSVRSASFLLLALVLAGCGGAGTHTQTILITPVTAPASADGATAPTP